MSVYQRNGTWMVAYRNEEGKRRDQTFGKGTEAEAKARLFDEQWKQFHKNKSKKITQHEIVSVIPDESTKQETLPVNNNCCNSVSSSKNDISLSELLYEYLEHTRSNGSSENHIKSLKTVGEGIFLPFFGKDKPITSIDYKDILALMQKIRTQPSLHGKPRSNTTINQYGNYLVAFFNYAIIRGYISSNPMKLWKKTKVNRREIKLTLDDASRIMSFAPEHVKWAMELSYHLGVRPGPCELFSLKWNDVDFNKKQVHVYASKTNTHRFIPVSDNFLSRLREMKSLSTCDYLVEYEGKPVKTIRKSFKNACKKAGIFYSIKMYDLRHMFATLMMNSGADIAAVSKLMGHSRISTTVNVYYESRAEEMKRAISVLPEMPAEYSNVAVVG